MKHPYRPITAAILALFLGLGAGAAGAAPQAEAMQPASEAARGLYWEGHQALEKGEWNVALERFQRLEAQLRKSGEAGADGAMYWQAYALTSSRRPREASNIAERMLREFPQSKWADDARAFTSGSGTARLADLQRIPGDAQQGSGKRDVAEEEALAAIDVLMTTGNPKAIPILERVLAGSYSDKVRTRALFVLIQIDQTAGERALDAILKGGASTRLKREAVKMLAVGGNRKSLDRLEALYRDSPEREIRHAVLEAWMIGGRSDLLGRVAATETDKRLRVQAIHLIGAAGDGATLERLYKELTDPDAREEVLTAFGIAGDDTRLAAIARSERDPKVQRAALQALGVAGGKDARAAILDIYRGTPDPKVKRAAIQGLIVAGSGASIAELYRTETDRDMKRELMHALSVTDGDAAIELIDKQLGGEN
jgi:HEAT repeat protein